MKKLILIVLSVSIFRIVFSQSGDYNISEFKKIVDNPTTSIKNQSKSGTCWSFSTLSMLESEILKTTGDKYDFSEMWVVRQAYIDKAIKYVRMHGTINFSGGGSSVDVINVWKKYGLVPEKAYPGIRDDNGQINHAEMDSALKSLVQDVVKDYGKYEDWMANYNLLLDKYLGEVADSFKYKETIFTPRTFANTLPINPDDYIVIGSYTHHPFYSSFILEIPDNWAWSSMYNIPIGELKEIIDYTLMKGHTIALAIDVSEAGFNWQEGLAVVNPNKSILNNAASSHSGAISLNDLLEMPVNSSRNISNTLEVNQDTRQEQFDQYQTTDDHGMQITGIFEASDKQKFYKLKNSWGTDNELNGYLFVSKQYVALKSTSIMINKQSLSAKMKQKLNLKK